MGKPTRQWYASIKTNHFIKTNVQVLMDTNGCVYWIRFSNEKFNSTEQFLQKCNFNFYEFMSIKVFFLSKGKEQTMAYHSKLSTLNRIFILVVMMERVAKKCMQQSLPKIELNQRGKRALPVRFL